MMVTLSFNEAIAGSSSVARVDVTSLKVAFVVGDYLCALYVGWVLRHVLAVCLLQ
jgi:hypothetical protein